MFGKEIKFSNGFAVKSVSKPHESVIEKLIWLFGQAVYLSEQKLSHKFIGPRKEMITPWSTNAVEITQNMGINGIERIEMFRKCEEDSPVYDPMLEQVFVNLDQEVFTIKHLKVWL